MANNKLNVIVIGAGSRGRAYTDIMADLPEKFKVVGVAEPIDDRREYIMQKHGVPAENAYTTWEDILAVPKFADVAIIATMDRMHRDPVMKALELGYDLLLEKPVAPTAEECAEIYNYAKSMGRKIMVCHVLRFTSYFRALKGIIDSGKLGDIISVEHTEAVGNVHQSHSFVRGNWGNAEESSPMLLQKCCHDLDILQWMLGKQCKKISSFGSLRYFTEKNAPAGAPDYCVDGCPEAENCPYNAVKLYYDDKKNDWFRGAMTKMAVPTDEAVMDCLKSTQYGKCVFKCNNNVVDHQVVNMEFDEGLTVAFTMTCFNEGGRHTKIYGTKGELWASMEQTEAKFFDFMTRKWETIPTNESAVVTSLVGGHGGGDNGIVEVLYDYVNGNIPAEEVSEIGVSCRNHMLVFAAEKSRHEGVIVDVEKFIKDTMGL